MAVTRSSSSSSSGRITKRAHRVYTPIRRIAAGSRLAMALTNPSNEQDAEHGIDYI